MVYFGIKQSQDCGICVWIHAVGSMVCRMSGFCVGLPQPMEYINK